MATETSATDEAARPLRADAARNRELILETAAKVFAEQGLDAGYDEIARRAGVGVGTVYRRFPERSELVQALFESRICDFIAIAEQANTHADAWEGLTWFLARALESQVADRGLKEVMARTISVDDHQAFGRDRLAPVIDCVLGRAKADGQVRADVEVTDLGALLMVMSAMSTPEQPDLWQRYLPLFLDGLRAREHQPPLPLAAPADDAMHELMCNMQGRQV